MKEDLAVADNPLGLNNYSIIQRRKYARKYRFHFKKNKYIFRINYRTL